MTKGLQNPNVKRVETLAKNEGIEKNQNLNDGADPNKAKIKGLFEQYEKEMRYLRNFSEHTLKGCWRVFNRWLRYIGDLPSETNLSQFVIEIRTASLNTTTCNISIVAFNSFLTWLKEKNL